jgi:hypothetical protein
MARWTRIRRCDRFHWLSDLVPISARNNLINKSGVDGEEIDASFLFDDAPSAFVMKPAIIERRRQAIDQSFKSWARFVRFHSFQISGNASDRVSEGS